MAGCIIGVEVEAIWEHDVELLQAIEEVLEGTVTGLTVAEITRRLLLSHQRRVGHKEVRATIRRNENKFLEEKTDGGVKIRLKG